MTEMTSAHAQNHFGQMLDTAIREPVTITKRGREVAIVISAEYAQEVKSWIALRNLEKYRAAATLDQRESITEEEINRLVHELR